MKSKTMRRKLLLKAFESEQLLNDFLSFRDKIKDDRKIETFFKIKLHLSDEEKAEYFIRVRSRSGQRKKKITYVSNSGDSWYPSKNTWLDTWKSVNEDIVYELALAVFYLVTSSKPIWNRAVVVSCMNRDTLYKRRHILKDAIEYSMKNSKNFEKLTSEQKTILVIQTLLSEKKDVVEKKLKTKELKSKRKPKSTAPIKSSWSFRKRAGRVKF